MYVENILERTYAPGLQQVHFRKNCAKLKTPAFSFSSYFLSSTQQKAKTQTTTHSRINNRTQHSNIAFPNNQLFSNMHSPKKQTTTTTHTCNQAILKQKHGLKTKRSKRPALAALSSSSSVLPVTSLVIATVLFQRHIPAVSGFGVKTQTFAPNPLNFRPNNPDLRQSQSTIMRPIDVVGLRALNYRSHDNLEEQQRQHEAAVGSSSSAAAASAATSDLTLSRDNSRQAQPTRSKHQQHQTHQQHHVSSFIHTWWTSAKSKRAFEQSALDRAKTDGADREQLVLDDYLESIDRRYKRLHKHERKQARAARLAAKRNINEYHLGTVSAHVPVITSAFQFLRLPQKEPTSAGEEQRKQEDAIYVLGLANLASKRLLQRHQLPIPVSKQDSKHSNSIVIDIHSKTMGRAVGPEDLNSISNSKSNSVSSSPAASTGVTTTTTTNTSNVLMVRMLASTALYALQLLKNTQSAYYARVASLILKAQSHAMNTAKFGGKALSVLLATVANLVTMNSGGKYALHFIGILMAGAVGFVRPLVSKA